MDIGIYSINGARYMVGEEPIWVTAQETKTNPEKFKEGVDETIQFEFGFPGGAVASCLSTYNMNYLDRFFLTGQKGFARARFAEDRVAALDQPIEVETQGHLHIQRGADREAMPALFVFVSEYRAEVVGIGEQGRGEMLWNGFDRAQFLGFAVAPGQHQHRLQRNDAEGAGTLQHFGQKRALGGRIEQNPRIRAAQRLRRAWITRTDRGGTRPRRRHRRRPGELPRRGGHVGCALDSGVPRLAAARR